MFYGISSARIQTLEKKTLLIEETLDHISISFEAGIKLLHILARQSWLAKSEHTGIKFLDDKLPKLSSYTAFCLKIVKQESDTIDDFRNWCAIGFFTSVLY
jgi:imidazoleglycerol phosphate dehydratase HisB